MNIESFREYCLSLPQTTEDMPFDGTLLRQLIDHAWEEVNKKLPKKDRLVRSHPASR